MWRSALRDRDAADTSGTLRDAGAAEPSPSSSSTAIVPPRQPVDESLSIAIVQMSGAPLAKVRLHKKSTIGEISGAISRMAGVSDSLLLLAFENNVLNPDLTLAEAGLSNGSVLTAIRYPQLFVAVAYEDGSTKLWSVETSQPDKDFEGDGDTVLAVALSPQGTKLATGGMDGVVRIWWVANKRCQSTMHCHKAPVAAVAMSHDGNLLATGSFDQSARLWNLATDQCLGIFPGHNGSVGCVSFSVDGNVLASSAGDGGVNLWGVVAASQKATMLQGHQSSVLCIGFGPNGRLVATGATDGVAKLWSIRSGMCHHTLVGHRGSVCAVAFAKDVTMVATGSADSTVRVWNVKRGHCVHTLQTTDSVARVRALAFSPGGTLLATGSEDGATRLWGLSENIEGDPCKAVLQGPRMVADRQQRPVPAHAIAFFAGPLPDSLP
mmetsp:Transcript_73151/g.145079  ORF Transcript_73151/g.145079 Transcript_73151/m.145079 type:complete len:437 (-) Transcript_73151:64-1374(-)|eukprot:CAMPEP_0172712066 /NCGR_PEP_ID=MMETSP1074-20121228/60884_1 /TAXON_ID=2916 /ORGANISM="Ceratium fusus, Strain PA161109" /LENGTH=436 /DNA_ID=CAMNT_0013535941 /DNA_START=118 /DNA_END=1428 /DNA_ORIENTATION=+